MVTEIDGGLRINLERKIDESYGIIIGSNLFPRIAQDLKQLRLGSKHAIVTDSNVRDLYADPLLKELRQAGLECTLFSFQAGEESKKREVSDEVIDRMHSEQYGRDTCVIALGGGVVGDLAGYVAATYNRGVPVVQIPTTTISQADSSVGGKVGVDTPHGKNLVGAFKQPKAVYIDVDTLKTLPKEHFVSGLAESIKHGIIYDAEYFNWLDENAKAILAKDPECLVHLAFMNCKIKGSVVEKDPNEKGLRRILNYGHTIGHALEKVSNYTLMHGNAVAIGMMVAGRIAVDKGLLDSKELERQRKLLEVFTLPVIIPDTYGAEDNAEDIIAATHSDKKAAGGKVRYCLPSRIGAMHEFDGAYATPVSDRQAINDLYEKN